MNTTSCLCSAVSQPLTTIVATSNGLKYKAYTNNTTGNAYSYNWDVNGSYTHCATFFTNNTPYGTGTVTTINNTYTIFGGQTSSIAATYYGYFKPNSSGVWSFMLGSTSLADDDLANLWIGSANQTIASLQSSATDTNYQKGVNYTVLGVANYSYTTSGLNAGTFYPIMFNWGQNSGGTTMYLYFCQTSNPTSGSSWISDMTGYFYN